MQIVIGSAGRRVYLVRWFQEALRRAGLGGKVYVFENDKNAASVAAADGFVHMPRYEDPEYRSVLLDAVEKIRPQLFFSLNDYELIRLSEGLSEEIRERGTVVPSLTPEAHTMVADKLAMYQNFNDAGIRTPITAQLTDFGHAEKLLLQNERVVLKDRFGSGSSGMQIVDSGDMLCWINCQKLDSHCNKTVITNPETLVVQPELSGQEYGLDIVTSLNGGPVAGILARRKLAMRNGETNVAETVEPWEFNKLAGEIVAALGSQGLIDVDVIRTPKGDYEVIDINPRFGGGYPFNHIAGADVPGFYVDMAAGNDVGSRWRQYQYGCKSAKFEDVVRHG